ncbi:MAG TPA: hypothetical protein VFQ88_10390 [Nevskiaceae bacterium]|nr:hypothetical protein [Nevskiaceae bacterium]
MDLERPRLAVIGVGYLGTPVEVTFHQRWDVLGCDINTERVAELRAGKDSTLEFSTAKLGPAAASALQH